MSPPDNLAHRTNSGGDTRYVFEYGFRDQKNKKMELKLSSYKNFNIKSPIKWANGISSLEKLAL